MKDVIRENIVELYKEFKEARSQSEHGNKVIYEECSDDLEGFIKFLDIYYTA